MPQFNKIPENKYMTVLNPEHKKAGSEKIRTGFWLKKVV